MNTSPLVSIIMATYNGEKYIHEAIQSILDQSHSNFEFIIINDGSTDATEAIITSFSDERIEYVKKPLNSGIADSLNLGIEMAKGKYIARMDDDDVSFKKRLQVQTNFLEHHKQIDLCASNVEILNKDKQQYEGMTHDELCLALVFGNALVHPSVMARSNFMKKFKYNPDKVPSEDYDLWSRMIWQGKFHKIQDRLLHYRYRKESETSRRRKEQLQLNIDIMEYMLEKAGLVDLPNHQQNIRIFASKDYSVSGNEVKGLVDWFEGLKRTNKENQMFEKNKFSSEVDNHIKQFLISYFSNKKLLQKIEPFIKLDARRKKEITAYYFNKLI